MNLRISGAGGWVERERTYREIAEDLVRTRIKHGLLKIKREVTTKKAIKIQHDNLIERWGPE